MNFIISVHCEFEGNVNKYELTVITSAKEVVFYPSFVRLSVC